MSKKKRRPLCSECEAKEMAQGWDCAKREQEAEARGEKYRCQCPLIECTHLSPTTK